MPKWGKTVMSSLRLKCVQISLGDLDEAQSLFDWVDSLGDDIHAENDSQTMAFDCYSFCVGQSVSFTIRLQVAQDAFAFCLDTK